MLVEVKVVLREWMEECEGAGMGCECEEVSWCGVWVWEWGEVGMGVRVG